MAGIVSVNTRRSLTPSSLQCEPCSVQAHVHGAFSEGVGSFASHSHEAARHTDGPSRREAKQRLAPAIVDVVHARGGLVSYNHMFGAHMADRALRADQSATKILQG